MSLCESLISNINGLQSDDKVQKIYISKIYLFFIENFHIIFKILHIVMTLFNKYNFFFGKAYVKNRIKSMILLLSAMHYQHCPIIRLHLAVNGEKLTK